MKTPDFQHNSRHLAKLKIAYLARGHFAPLAGARQQQILYTASRVRRSAPSA
jgi:hypothetical protein